MILAGRRVFWVDTDEEIVVRLGNLASSLDSADHVHTIAVQLGLDLRADDDLWATAEDEFERRHPAIGRLAYDDLWQPGSLFIVTTEVHPAWRRRGVASWMADIVMARYPGMRLMAARWQDSTSNGRAWVDALNAFGGGDVIQRLDATDSKSRAGYAPIRDSEWPRLLRRHLPND